MIGRLRTASTKEGWTKTGRGEYTHEAGHVVRKTGQGWAVSGPSEMSGYVYSTLWAAMSGAAGTPAVFTH